MIETALTRYQLDRNRVYVLGLSAGGSMSAVMLANYPDLFAGGGIIAGTPFDCNRGSGLTWGLWLWYRTFFGDAASATYSCGLLGYMTTNRTAAEWGDYVRAVTDTSPNRWPIVSIWTGTADRTVDPANRQELIEQWTNVHGIDAHPDLEVSIGDATRMVFEDPAGAELVESWQAKGFPHAFPIDPELGPEACGHPGPFIVDANICAVRRIAEFWGLLE
jgi:poly(3-hydroxybutyrate) depolymerase